MPHPRRSREHAQRRGTPAGTHHVLGLVYVACDRCTDICLCCGGIGIFPADSTCPHCLTDAMTAVGYTATFCHTCAGVLTVDKADGSTVEGSTQ